MSTNAERGPVAGAPFENNHNTSAGGREGSVDRVTTSAPSASAATLPLQTAILLLAVAGALFDRLLVRSCVYCGCAHLHYLPVGGETSGIVRAPRCRPSRRYVVEVVDVLPVPATVAGQRRRVGAV